MSEKKTIKNDCSECDYYNRLVRICTMNEINKHTSEICLIYENDRRIDFLERQVQSWS